MTTGNDLISQVTAYVGAAEAENAADDAQIAALQADLADLNAQIVSLQADDAADAAQIAALQLQAATLQDQIAALQSNDASDAAQIATLTSQVATLQAENDALEAQNEAEDDARLDLGNLAITLTTQGESATEAKFDLPDGSSVVRPFPESGPLTMKLGLGLSLNHHRAGAGGGGGAPEWVPEDAIAWTSFVDGFAAGVEGDSYEVTDLFGPELSDPYYTGDYDPAGLTAQGMVFAQGANEAYLNGPLLAEVFGPHTYVFHFTLDSFDNNVLLHLIDVAGVNLFQINAFDLSSSGFANAPVLDWAADYVDVGEQKLALTITDTGVAASLNGNAVRTDTSSAIPAMTIAAIGHYTEGGFFSGKIRSFMILPPRDNGDLPGLSALS